MLYQNLNLEKDLEDEEGICLTVYKDSRGFETIGIGTCIALGHGGITLDEAYYLMRNRIDRAYQPLAKLAWFNVLDEVRQAILIEMVFNMGFEGLMEFKEMISAIQVRDYQKASIEMLHSKWAAEVPKRANRLAVRMNTGRG